MAASRPASAATRSRVGGGRGWAAALGEGDIAAQRESLAVLVERVVPVRVRRKVHGRDHVDAARGGAAGALRRRRGGGGRLAALGHGPTSAPTPPVTRHGGRPRPRRIGPTLRRRQRQGPDTYCSFPAQEAAVAPSRRGRRASSERPGPSRARQPRQRQATLAGSGVQGSPSRKTRTAGSRHSSHGSGAKRRRARARLAPSPARSPRQLGCRSPRISGRSFPDQKRAGLARCHVSAHGAPQNGRSLRRVGAPHVPHGGRGLARLACAQPRPQ